MSCLGVHFALSAEDLATLRSLSGDEKRLEFLIEEVEQRYMDGEKTYAAESDKAWDAMHRLLGDGDLSYDGAGYPLSHVVLGGEPLYSDDDYIVSLKSPQQVKDVAAAIVGLDQQRFRALYDALDPDDYDGEMGDEDFEYTWDWFQGVRALFIRAADEGRAIVFTADQ